MPSWSIPKAQEDILKCLVSSSILRYSAYYHRGAKTPENIHTTEAGGWSFDSLALKEKLKLNN